MAIPTEFLLRPNSPILRDKYKIKRRLEITSFICKRLIFSVLDVERQTGFEPATPSLGS